MNGRGRNLWKALAGMLFAVLLASFFVALEMGLLR